MDASQKAPVAQKAPGFFAFRRKAMTFRRSGKPCPVESAAALRSLALPMPMRLRREYEGTIYPNADPSAGETWRNSLILRNWGAWDGGVFKGTDGLRKLAFRRRNQLKNRDTIASRHRIGVFLHIIPLPG
jgi:hypothetical protein